MFCYGEHPHHACVKFQCQCLQLFLLLFCILSVDFIQQVESHFRYRMAKEVKYFDVHQ